MLHGLVRRRVAETVAARSATSGDLRELRERYDAADVDGDTWLNAEELRGVLECSDSFCLNTHWLPLEQVERIMVQYDVNGDGRIGFDEFVNLAQDKQLLEGKLEEYMEAFEGMDKDGSGFIDQEEMQAYMITALGATQGEVSKLMAEGDTNADDKIDFAEFLGLIRSRAIDLQQVFKYLEMTPMQQDTKKQTKIRPSALPIPGEVNMVHGKSQMDYILSQVKTPIILMIAFHWCRPCKGFAKKYERFADGFKDDLTFLKVYGEENEDTKLLVKSLQVKSSPSFYIFNHGKFEPVSSFKGANEDRFRTRILEFQNDAIAENK
uniref:Calmodulin n=2 Tax=Lotharella globosa TaxID=91324 RepID=A0A7S4DRS6_9EUKA